MQKSVIAIVLAVLVAGCATNSNHALVTVADGLRFALRAPAGFGQQVLLVQAATLSFGEQTHELLFHTEITSTHIAIVGSLPGGARLFSIGWDGSTLQSDGYEDLLARIPPAYFVADLQLAQWPLAEVRTGFSAACFSAGTCALTESADGLQRQLSVAGEPVISISYGGVPHHQHDAQYEHLGRQYRLTIETLDVQTLAAAR